MPLAQQLLLVATVAALVIALRWPSLSLPLDCDEGAYASIAMGAQHGWGRAYLELVDHKPPLLYAIYSLAFRSCGWTALGLRVFSSVWQAVTAVVFALLLSHWGLSRRAMGAGSVTWVALCCAWNSQAMAANAEGWTWLPVLLGLAFLRPLQESRSWRRWILWGFFAGLAACIKQPLYLFAVALPLGLEAPPRWAKALAATALGLALAHLPFLLQLQSQGALRAWFWWVFLFNAGYCQPWSATVLQALARFLKFLALEQGGVWLLALLAWSVWPRGAEARLSRLGLLLTALGAVAAASSGRWFPHYAQHLSLGLALSVTALFEAQPGPRMQACRRIAAAVAVGSFALAELPFWINTDARQNSLRLFGPSPYVVDAPAVADWVQAHSGPQDRVLIWGAAPEIYFLAQRPPATRTLNNFSLVGSAPEWPGAEEDFLKALDDPRVQVAILAAHLNPSIPLQQSLSQGLLSRFDFSQQIGAGYIVGLRRPPIPSSTDR